MRRHFGILFLATALFAVPFFSSAQSAEEIVSFASDITVGEDGRLMVTETIDYRFPAPRHGIIRDIPLRYETDDGETFVLPARIISVTGAPYSVSKDRTTLSVRIGDPDRMVTGVQRYAISYAVDGGLRYFEDHDELYWNVTGTDWGVPIRRVNAIVRLPEAIPIENVAGRCLTGPFGSTEEDCLYNVQGHSVHFAADDMLTVVVGWRPTGLVARIEPKKAFAFPPWAAAATTALMIIGLPLLTLGAVLSRMRKAGVRTKERHTLVVQYDPPDRLSPAEVGLLADGRVDGMDVSATIVDLAVRGYLGIEELPGRLWSKDYAFDKRKGSGEGLKPHEERIFGMLFGTKDRTTVRELKQKYVFNAGMGAIRSRLRGQLTAKGYFDDAMKRVRDGSTTAGVLLGVLGLIVVFAGAAAESGLIAALGAALMISAPVAIFLSSRVEVMSEAGVRAREYARGFREYIAKAERYRIEWQEKEHVFEEFLPYAMVFGVVDKWTDAFADMQLPAPDWYSGAAVSAGAFDSRAFGNMVSSLGSAVVTAVRTSPKSASRSGSGSWRSSGGSGFSSGGSSGGGFGGGGGRSW